MKIVQTVTIVLEELLEDDGKMSCNVKFNCDPPIPDAKNPKSPMVRIGIAMVDAINRQLSKMSESTENYVQTQAPDGTVSEMKVSGSNLSSAEMLQRARELKQKREAEEKEASSPSDNEPPTRRFDP